MTPERAWEEAIRIVGSKARMAREIGVSRQRLERWVKCQAEFVLKAENAVALAMKRIRRGVTRHDLRPDLYPRNLKHG